MLIKILSPKRHSYIHNDILVSSCSIFYQWSLGNALEKNTVTQYSAKNRKYILNWFYFPNILEKFRGKKKKKTRIYPVWSDSNWNVMYFQKSKYKVQGAIITGTHLSNHCSSQELSLNINSFSSCLFPITTSTHQSKGVF